jgi:hypothetical protein
VAVLVALAAADLVHHALEANSHEHGTADICLAVVAGVGLAAVTVAGALLVLPRRTTLVTLGSASLRPAPPPTPAARAGPTATVVLRL